MQLMILSKKSLNNIVDTDSAKEIQEEINKVKDDLEDFTGSLKRNK